MKVRDEIKNDLFSTMDFDVYYVIKTVRLARVWGKGFM